MKEAEYTKLVLKATNKLLNYIEDFDDVPCGLPAASALIKDLDVSRTTFQKLIDILIKKGIVRQDGLYKIVLRKPGPDDYYSVESMGNSKADLVEKQIIKKLSSYELKPGDRFSELEIANELKTNTIITREALFKIAQSGIIKKHPRQKWEVVEFSPRLIEEIAEIRKMYERHAIQKMRIESKTSPIWKELTILEKKHVSLLKKTSVDASEMRDIERAFHTTIIDASHNRFIKKSYTSIFTLIFFHLGQIEYDQQKIETVLKHHLTILQALLEHDFIKAQESMEMHLDYAKNSMTNINTILDKKNEEVHPGP
ncbi:GntR family transcriptional regulator [Daejeonella sp.]|uniref:GntR family transcriptional regulator n=1 Tax=Daejeonella sp. TaxID=2805397 RepID=UPI0030C1C9C0